MLCAAPLLQGINVCLNKLRLVSCILCSLMEMPVRFSDRFCLVGLFVNRLGKVEGSTANMPKLVTGVTLISLPI